MRYALTQNNTFPFQALGLFDHILAGQGTHSPAVDIIQKANEYLLTVDLPGYEQKDVGINFEGDVLTIKGKREEESNQETDRVFFRERVQGEFERSFRFKNIDADKISAEYVNGVVKIHLPLREEVKPKKIEINFN